MHEAPREWCFARRKAGACPKTQMRPGAFPRAYTYVRMPCVSRMLQDIWAGACGVPRGAGEACKGGAGWVRAQQTGIAQRRCTLRVCVLLAVYTNPHTGLCARSPISISPTALVPRWTSTAKTHADRAVCSPGVSASLRELVYRYHAETGIVPALDVDLNMGRRIRRLVPAEASPWASKRR